MSLCLRLTDCCRQPVHVLFGAEVFVATFLRTNDTRTIRRYLLVITLQIRVFLWVAYGTCCCCVVELLYSAKSGFAQTRMKCRSQRK
ncbi:hypothetical protein ARMGADRAFT_95520 [Armillaria gallica]|uniref:Uncharacterized protein n=1 Tax=Armillaria gallica TaxID=47427 RepID=A0A2H3CXG9_ARMGA|nr:hypothetical protein ARMGADRAFT_95520 [Armillaria gallica]